MAASQELEKRELSAALKVKEEEGRILAAANETLRQAQHKSKRWIQFGSAFLAGYILVTIVTVVLNNNAQKELLATQLEQTGIKLSIDRFGGEIENLLKAMQAVRELKSLVKAKTSLADYPAYSPIFTLQDILLNIRERNQLQGHQDRVNSVAFSPDRKTLASASKDTTIKLWNLSTGKQISTFNGLTGYVLRVAFSPDRKTLASAASDKTIKLWNLSTGKQISTFTGHTDVVYSVAFSPDRKTLASASIDTSIKLWSLDLDDLLARGCNYLKDYFANHNEKRKELCQNNS